MRCWHGCFGLHGLLNGWSFRSANLWLGSRARRLRHRRELLAHCRWSLRLGRALEHLLCRNLRSLRRYRRAGLWGRWHLRYLLNLLRLLRHLLRYLLRWLRYLLCGWRHLLRWLCCLLW